MICWRLLDIENGVGSGGGVGGGERLGVERYGWNLKDHEGDCSVERGQALASTENVDALQGCFVHSPTYTIHPAIKVSVNLKRWHFYLIHALILFEIILNFI